jgi:repressor LexA
MNQPTDRQAEVLATIKRLIKERGYPPTVAELMAALDIASPTGVTCHLKALRAKGKLTWQDGKSRTLRLL